MTNATDWQGRVGRTWAEEANRTERAFAGIAALLDRTIAEVAPATGRALDIGCGVGSTALALAAARPGLAVTGVDLSPDLVAVAASRAGASTAFVHGDAVAVAADLAPLDLLVSRHGVMFFADPAAAFAALRAAARAGAPLVFSCFGARADNDWVVAVDEAIEAPAAAAADYAPGPFGFADDVFVASLLKRTGWREAHVAAHAVPYLVGVGDDPVADALGFFRRIGPAAAVLAAAPHAARARIEDRLAAALAARTRDGAVAFTASIRIWHAVAGERE